MANAMFEFDEDMTDLILAACRARLRMEPVPLDFGGLVESLDAELAGLMRPEGNDATHVLKLFVDKLSTAVVSCDSPRFLSFIPAAPTKASLLFDMFVSCSSLHGTSWLEAAGVVVAENQALAVLAAQAGFPATAGGCFVAGGSAGNLSASMVARHRRPPAPGRRAAATTGCRQRRRALVGRQGPARARDGCPDRAGPRAPAHRARAACSAAGRPARA